MRILLTSKCVDTGLRELGMLETGRREPERAVTAESRPGVEPARLIEELTPSQSILRLSARGPLLWRTEEQKTTKIKTKEAHFKESCRQQILCVALPPPPCGRVLQTDPIEASLQCGGYS